MRVCVVVLPLSLLVLSASSLYGQDTKPIQPGDRVRACYTRTLRSGAQTLECGRYVGDFLSLTADAVRMRAFEGGAVIERAVPLDSITRFDTYIGPLGNAGKGALIGAGIGAAVGGLLGVVWPDMGCGDRGVGCVLGIAAKFGVPSAFLGFLVGAADRWDEIPLEQLRVQPVATVDGRFGLGVSLSF